MSPAQPAFPLGVPSSRSASGTAWQPDASPMYADRVALGAWTLMLHGVVFPEYDHQNGFRGDADLGLIDWEMLMAARSLGGGVFRLSGMTSFEALTLPEKGYPELLQTGESYQHERVANYQHSHDLLMELSAAYDHQVARGLAASLYVAAVGEPALGPVAYMHRASGANDPFAPLGHHWQDAAHESNGVVTAGLYTRYAKLEGSAFNGREPDQYHYNIDYAGARLDSYSGRVTVVPTSNIAIATWGGYIYSHDPLEPNIGMQRYGASILTSSSVFGDANRSWSNAVVWGLNIHHHGPREHDHSTLVPKTYHMSSSVLVETNVDVTEHLSLFGRAEQVQKDADDLGFLGEGTQLFTIRAISLGATRDIVALKGASIGFGARGTMNVLPQTLHLVYTTTTPTGFAVYFRIRPKKMASAPGGMGM
jgi:hypothetical protein